MTCYGSVAMCRRLPERPSGKAAWRGTTMHQFVNRCLGYSLPPSTYEGWAVSPTGHWLTSNLGEEPGAAPYYGEHLVIGPEEVRGATVMTDYVWSEVDRLGPDAKTWFEYRFDLTWLRPDMGGTADAMVLGRRELSCIDYKNGDFVRVDVAGNSQLMYYLLGAARAAEWEFDVARLTVVQPFHSHPDGPVRWVEVTPDELRAFAAKLATASDRCDEPDAPRVPGDHCMFCPGKYFDECAEHRDYAANAALYEFTVIEENDFGNQS